MPGKQAKILSVGDVSDLLVFAACTRHPIRNRVIVLLSAKAGLRAGEIASLTWDMVVDAGGKIGNVIELRDHAAKNGSGRLIPMHSELDEVVCNVACWRNSDQYGAYLTVEISPKFVSFERRGSNGESFYDMFNEEDEQ